MPDRRKYTLGKTKRKQSMQQFYYPTRFHQLIRDIISTNSFIIFKSIKFSLYLNLWNIWIEIFISRGMYIIFTLLWNIFLVNFNIRKGLSKFCWSLSFNNVLQSFFHFAHTMPISQFKLPEFSSYICSGMSFFVLGPRVLKIIFLCFSEALIKRIQAVLEY